MKKAIYIIFILSFLMYAIAYSQKPVVELTFAAQYQSQNIILDSIYIENLTQGGDTMLYAPNTVLVLYYTLGVVTNPALTAGSLVVSQNRPNPFTEQTIISIFLPEKDHLQVSVINLLGQKVAFFENSLDAGNHSFVFYPGDDKYYILTATANGLTKTIKMISLNIHSGKSCSLNYWGADETQTGYKSSQDTDDFGYSLGDLLRFTGFAKNPSDIVGSDVIEATPAGNENYVFEIIEGIPCPGTPTVTYEGQTYNTVQIGTQCWFKENLNVGTMIDGVNNQTNNTLKEKYCYNNDPTNCETYGGLYQWEEMMQSNQQGTQGICPSGWHIPTDVEWTTLFDFLGGDSIAGGKMKTMGTIEAGTGLWHAPNEGASNSSGFTALPGGNRSYGGLCDSWGFSAEFWSSTWDEQDYAWGRYMYFDFTDGVRMGFYEGFGLSSRCVKGEIASFPYVTTSGISNITWTTAISGGNVTFDGGTTVTERGVCWSTSPNPTIADSHTSDGTGTGIFVSQLTGLTINTAYYLRAYATNIIGTEYGNQIWFVTVSEGEPCPEIPIVTYEGQTYNTVQLGVQCWFKENLNVGTMIDGLSNQSNNNQKEKYCYNNNPVNCATYGGLYQWDEMMQYSILPGTQGICPYGWHLPSDAEWTILTDFLGGENVAGGKIKTTGTIEAGTGLWYAPNAGATNESGFSALPGGYRSYDGYFGLKGDCAFFWSSTEYKEYGTNYAWLRFLGNNFSEVYRYQYYHKVSGFSVRCLQGGGTEIIPTVNTSGITNITQTTATCGGNVTSDAGATVTERGVCWSTSQNPTIADSHTSDGTGTGIFVSNLNGLTLNMLYYVRAYATNINGTAYGNQVSFNTVHQPCPGIPTVTYEGQTYNTEQIADQCWLKENLNVGTFIYSSNNQTNNNLIEKYCYANDFTNCSTSGGLYQWDEMMQYTTMQGTQGICPSDFHIPTDVEWTILTDFLGGENVAGGKMKETSFVHWKFPNYGATNESGFTALPGEVIGGGAFDDSPGYYAYFWSSTDYSTNNAWIRNLVYDLAGMSSYQYNKNAGLSVRCILDEGASPIPTVTTAGITNITQTTATSGGNVTSDGGTTVTDRGVCWSTSQNPTIADNHTSDGTGTGIFVSNLNGLTLSTTYYIRAYATNSVATAYGNEVSFTTLHQPCPGIPTVSYEGQIYNTVQIGAQCWFKENLNVGTMIDGVNEQSNNNLKEKYCYDNNLDNCAIYGGLYQWDEMMQYTTQQGTQGNCPSGWHIPSDDEWTVLTDFLGGDSVAGGKMKSTGTIQAGTGLWYSPNSGATNESGFTALPGSFRDFGGAFYYLGYHAYFWSSTEINMDFPWGRYLPYDLADVELYEIYVDIGNSVRCVKD